MTSFDRAHMAFGVCWWIQATRLGVWNFGFVLTVDRLTWCVIADLNVGPWTVRAGVNR